MKTILALVALLFVAASASAQSPIVIGPASVLEWGENATGVTPALAQGFVYALTVDTAAPKTLTAVACIAGPVGTVLCSVPAIGNVPIGAHSLTLTASDGVTTTLPSAPFSYLTLVIPVPTGLRIR
jgi:hypothetical protein